MRRLEEFEAMEKTGRQTNFHAGKFFEYNLENSVSFWWKSFMLTLQFTLLPIKSKLFSTSLLT